MFKWANGDKYDGQWDRGLMDGQGTMIQANGDKYVGKWREGKRWGSGTFT